MKDKQPTRFVFTVDGELMAADEEDRLSQFNQAGTDPYYATKYFEHLGTKFPQSVTARYEITDYFEPQKPVKRLVINGKVTNGSAST